MFFCSWARAFLVEKKLKKSVFQKKIHDTSRHVSRHVPLCREFTVRRYVPRHPWFKTHIPSPVSWPQEFGMENYTKPRHGMVTPNQNTTKDRVHNSTTRTNVTKVYVSWHHMYTSVPHWHHTLGIYKGRIEEVINVGSPQYDDSVSETEGLPRRFFNPGSPLKIRSFYISL